MNSNLTTKTEEKHTRQKRSDGVYYSFLTFILVLCLIQIGWGMILNISKTISYKAKIITLQKIRDNAEKQNKTLKQEVGAFSSTTSVEEIARNNLKMVGADEVLILINEKGR
jgi:cell division protein FtsL